MKKILLTLLLLILLILLCGCATSRQYKNYSELRGLMLLENEQHARNKYFYSKNNQKKLKQANKAYHKRTKYRLKSR
jgi:ABC-type phosphate/phosphonate transport system substrate-binding protein